MPEPTLSDVHADLVGRLKHDDRLRQVEQDQAAMRAAIAELPRMEDRIMGAISEVKKEITRVDTEVSAPRPVWQAVSALSSVAMLAFVFFALVYGR